MFILTLLINSLMIMNQQVVNKDTSLEKNNNFGQLMINIASVDELQFTIDMQWL